MAILTSRTLATGVTGSDLIHIVITGDTSQNPAGSSYKATISQIFDSLSAHCITDLYVTNVYGCSPINVFDLTNFQSGITVNQITGTTSGLSGVTGDSLVVHSNIIPGNTYSLGSPDRAWEAVWVGPTSLQILPESITGSTITLSNLDSYLRVQSGGLIVESTSGITPSSGVFRVDPGGQIFMTSSYLNPNNTAVLEIIGNDNGYTVYPLNSGTMIHVTGHDNLNSRIINDSYGDTAWSQYGGRNAGGTAQFPTATKAGPIARYAGIGYRPGAGFGNLGDQPSTWIDFYSKVTFTSGSTPTEMRFYTTKTNEVQGSLSMVLEPSGITLSQTGSSITFGDSSNQTTAYLGTATISKIGGVVPDGVTITITSGGTISAVGASGGTGTSGISGISGGTGTSGISGISGVSGVIGVSGISGISGISGGTGTSGISGISGVSGGTGTSGISGIAGTTSGRAWGSFVSTVDQTNGVPGFTYKMSADTTLTASGVTLSGTSLGAAAKTRFVVSNPGVYNIQFSAQFSKRNGTKSNLFIWLSKNGTAVPISNTEMTMDKGGGEREVAAWNWVDEATTANTYYEIEWTDSQGNVFIDYEGSPTYGPAIPSVIVTVTQV